MEHIPDNEHSSRAAQKFTKNMIQRIILTGIEFKNDHKR